MQRPAAKQVGSGLYLDQRDMNLLALFNVTLDASNRWNLRGSLATHLLSARRLQTLRLLGVILRPWPENPRAHDWLLKYRPEIRALVDLGQVTFLAYIAQKNPTRRIRRFIIWLIGRCQLSLSIEMIDRFRHDPRIKREIIRAYRRLGASVQLDQIAMTEQDPRLRKWAGTFKREDYSRRLARFTSGVERRSMHLAAPFEMRTDVELTPHRPKPRWRIRMILERIRRIIRSDRWQPW